MREFAKLAVVTAAAVMIAASAAAQPRERLQAGTLTCDISGGIGFIIGSQRTLNCSFTPGVPGPIEFYAGTLTKLGVDIGVTTGGVMVWVVYAPSSRGRPARLPAVMAVRPPKRAWWRASVPMC